jgi:DNA-binding transcriptional MerR regulator
LNDFVPKETSAPKNFTLSELTATSGVSQRTIRYYQAERLLPQPAKQGRDAVYNTAHLDRLTLIGELRDRGLSLQTIGELLTSEQPNATISEWLGVDATLTAPWSDDRSRTLTKKELNEQIHSAGLNRPGTIGELLAANYLQSQSDGTWSVRSPALLQHALRLQRAGIDIDITGRVRDLLRRRLAKAVDDTVKLLVERTGSGFAGRATAQELNTAIEELRPVALEMSSLIFAQEVERALAELIQSGPAKLSRSVRR